MLKYFDNKKTIIIEIIKKFNLDYDITEKEFYTINQIITTLNYLEESILFLSQKFYNLEQGLKCIYYVIKKMKYLNNNLSMHIYTNLKVMFEKRIQKDFLKNYNF